MIKSNKNIKPMPNFDDAMADVENDIKEHEVEENIVGRVRELIQLSDKICLAKDALIAADMKMDNSYKLYKATVVDMCKAIIAVDKSIGKIHNHIDNIMKNAPSKLTVSVRVSDEDWAKITQMFDEQREEQLAREQKHILKVNDMLVQERKNIQERYRESDGIYLGHKAQWVAIPFFFLGVAVLVFMVVYAVFKHCGLID